ncbi:hypothetical protein [Loktanella sp. SALINAS62]|uniref:NYN domain-containing protein n=1 Tax=Loktanella sp. SALINAS62 TaxID=2706124 RepID=UPI001B8AC3F1|nr:hypothetical protein [Loktanella sp. SALINAS62]MBS1304318.1 hypothetical protein [Loktanella sp. SALINAS62]
MISDLAVVGLFGLFLMVLLAVLLVRRARRVGTTAAGPQASVIVDGSNVMHWGGGDPSLIVLTRVLQSLRDDKGHIPAVVFDANVGYKLFNRFHGHAAMASAIDMPQHLVLVVDRGVIADEAILDVAARHNLPVVSNDRFRDWSVQYPWVRKKGRVLRGTWKDGSVRWAH